ncbi:MAG: LuxR C-terminal-related transcriptional regulator [Burkholderiaceae bacterium]
MDRTELSQPVDEPTFDDCIRRIYRAAAGHAPWSDAADAITAAFDLFCVHIIGVDKRDGRLMFSWGSSGLSAQGELLYITGYHEKNPRLGPAMALRDDQWVHDHLQFSDHYVAHSPFFQEYAIPYGYRYLSGTKIVDDDRHVVLLGVVRTNHARPLDGAEIAQLSRLRRHFVEAMQIYLRLRHTADRVAAGHTVLDALPQAAFLVDGMQRVRYRNRAADELLASGRLVSLQERRLCLSQAADHARMVALASALLRGDALTRAERGETFLRVGEAGTTGSFLLFGLPARPEPTMQAFGTDPLAVLLMHPIGLAEDIDPFVVGQVLGLTPAEASVATALAQGETPAQISAQRGVSLHTIRSQLRAIYDKTRVTRQADLVRLIVGISRIEPWGSGGDQRPAMAG